MKEKLWLRRELHKIVDQLIKYDTKYNLGKEERIKETAEIRAIAIKLDSIAKKMW